MIINMCKQIRLIIILIFVFVLTGCKAIYNIDILNDKIVQTTNFYAEDSDLDYYSDDINSPPSSFEELIDSYYIKDYRPFIYNFNNSSNYKKKKINDSNGQGIQLKYVYNYDNFKNSSLFDSTYESGPYINDKNFIIIDFDNLYESFFPDDVTNFNKLTVNIKTKLKVLENNADSVKGNVYTWNINRKNAGKKRIYIKIRKRIVYKNYYTVSFVFFFLIIIISLFVIVVKKKNKVSNDF